MRVRHAAGRRGRVFGVMASGCDRWDGGAVVSVEPVRPSDPQWTAVVVIGWCGWQAVNAPYKGGQLTTTAAVGNWSIN